MFLFIKKVVCPGVHSVNLFAFFADVFNIVFFGLVCGMLFFQSRRGGLRSPVLLISPSYDRHA